MAHCPHCNEYHPDDLMVCPNTDRLITQAAPPADPLIGSELEGKYFIERKLGEGGMGAVYLGEHKMMKRKVAIKTLLPRFSTNANAVQRFQREAQAASNIGHPNIVTIHDLGQTPDGTLYIVMEMLEGQDLGQELRALRKGGGGILDPRRALSIMRQVAEGLAAAHEKGVVHRDLKPDNIFLTKDRDGGDRVRLLDFGISKIRTPGGEEARLTTDGSLLGTPYYMSPEQAQGKSDIDHRADIYAFGVILYELLVGRVPFEDENMLRVIVMHAREDPTPPRHVNPSIPAEVESLILRAMAKEPSVRVQTMNDMLGAIESVGASAYGMTFAGVNTTGPLPVASSSGSGSLPKTNISGPLPVVRSETPAPASWGASGSGPQPVNSRVGETTGSNQRVGGAGSWSGTGSDGSWSGATGGSGSWPGTGSGNVSQPGMTQTPMGWSQGEQPKKGGLGLKIGLVVVAVMVVFGLIGVGGVFIYLNSGGDDDGDDSPPVVADPTPQVPQPQNPTVPANQPPYGTNPAYPTNPGNPGYPTPNPYGANTPPVGPATNPNPGQIPTTPPAPAKTQRVTLAFVSTPSKVEVFRDESRLGTTPFNIQVDRLDQEMTLIAKRSGYQDQEVAVTPNEDQTINIELERVERPRRGNRGSRGAKSSPRRGERPRNNNRPSNPLLKQMPDF